MKIALICTDNESLSLGMRAISAALKERGHHSRLLFMETGARVFSQAVLQELSSVVQDCDVVGFSCLAQGSTKAKQVLEYLKLQDKISLWGGVHASLNPEECVKYADYVCLGEGEGMIVEFLDRLSDHRDFRDMLNIAYKENGKLVKNDVRPLISNLDELPLPDFSFDDEHHLTKDGIKQVFTLHNVERNRQIVFTSSRGCAFFCTYCCNIKLKNLYVRKEHYVRRMSVSRLIEHSQQLRKIFPNGKYFYFIDEDFAARPGRELAELAERFPGEVGLPFECLAHPNRITEQKLDLLAAAGLFRIRIGVESGSARTKTEVYNRHVSNESVNRAATIISKVLHVAPVYFFIYSNPYEDREDILATLRLIELLPYGASIQAFELMFFPGSLLFDRAIQDKLIQTENKSHELSYYGGLHHEEYPWKRKNLYLNGLLFLASGHCTRFRIGIIPRFLFKLLIHTRVVDFNEKHTYVISKFILLKQLLFRLRSLLVQFLKIFVKDPHAIYNLNFFIRNKRALKA
jgi:radical SAM superfamily enzyme YgiQ (UPF0313 family)